MLNDWEARIKLKRKFKRSGLKKFIQNRKEEEPNEKYLAMSIKNCF